MKAVVLIPCYTSSLQPHEVTSVRQVRKILGHHTLQVFSPFGLDLPPELQGLEVTRFDAKFFTSPKAYSRLLTSLTFYEQYLKYDWLLIHQLDAYVFKDELEYWCKKGYQYIGAPWKKQDFLENRRSRGSLPSLSKYPLISRILYGQDFRVGNGGFSLRDIKACHHILQQNPQISQWPRITEDLFWSLHAPRLQKSFRVAPEQQAMRFSLEVEPRVYFEKMNRKLPFGCHAWEKYDPDFWKPFIS